jgi:hypothetical protein
MGLGSVVCVRVFQLPRAILLWLLVVLGSNISLLFLKTYRRRLTCILFPAI